MAKKNSDVTTITQDEPEQVEERGRDFYRMRADSEQRMQEMIDHTLSLKQPDAASQERHFWEMAACAANHQLGVKSRAAEADQMLVEWRTRWAGK